MRSSTASLGSKVAMSAEKSVDKKVPMGKVPMAMAVVIITCRRPCVNIVVRIQFERLGLMYNACQCSMNLIIHSVVWGTVSALLGVGLPFPKSSGIN